MPELPNRDSLEADFVKKFGKVARAHMHEFRELLGNPPDIENVPPEFWERMEKESEHDVYPFLFLIFTTGAAMYHWRGAIANLAGFGFSSERSRTFGQQWVESTRQKLESAQQAISEAIRRGEQAERFADFAGHEPASQQTIPPGGRTKRPVPVRPMEPDEDPEEFSSEEWRRILDDVFGAKRILQNVEDLTTEARHEGQERAVEATTGLSPDDLWINTGSNVCPICVSLNEKPRSFWSRFFPAGPPTPHIHCILPGQSIIAPGLFNGAVKSLYHGMCVEIRLACGRSISVTKNHPILTSSGWVFAGRLTKGMNVICCTDSKGEIFRFNPNDNDRPAAIEDVFASLLMSDSMMSMRMPVAPVAFYGDGEFIDGDIEIVRPNGTLLNEREPSLLKHSAKSDLVVADGGSSSLTPNSLLALSLERNGLSTDSVVSPSDLPLDLLGSCSGPSQVGSVGAVSNNASRLHKAPPKNRSLNTSLASERLFGLTSVVEGNDLTEIRNGDSLLGRRFNSLDSSLSHQLVEINNPCTCLAAKFMDAFPSEISLSEIVEIREFRYDGHVYDIEVKDYELYVCNGIIAKNCKCEIQYATVTPQPPITAGSP